MKPVLFCSIGGCWYSHFSFSQRKRTGAGERGSGSNLMTLALWPQALGFLSSHTGLSVFPLQGTFLGTIVRGDPRGSVAHDWAQIWSWEKWKRNLKCWICVASSRAECAWRACVPCYMQNRLHVLKRRARHAYGFTNSEQWLFTKHRKQTFVSRGTIKHM